MAIEFATPITPALFDKLLKEFYLGPIRDVLNSKTILLKRFQRDEINVSGRNTRIPIRVGRNEGQGFISAGSRLPMPGRQRFEPIVIPMKYSYMRIFFDGTAVAASKNDAGAFARVADTEITGATIDLANEWNRVLFGNGTGRLAQISAHTGGTLVYTVTNPGGFSNVGPGVQYLRPNMIVGCFNETTDQFLGSATINSVDVPTGTVTLSSEILGVNPAVGTFYFYRVSDDTAGVPGSLPDGSWARFNEPVGLAGAVSNTGIPGPGGTTANYLTIDATATPVWQSPVIDNGGISIPLDLDVLQQAEDAADQAGDGMISLFITSYGLRRSLLNLLQANKRFFNTLELEGGFKALEYNGKAFVPDKDATWGRLYPLDEATWAMYQEAPTHWIDDDGHILFRDSNRDAFQAALRSFWEVATTARNRNVLVTDLLDPT